MTTPRIRRIVSLAVSAIALSPIALSPIALTACAGRPAPEVARAPRPTIRFDNEARVPVQVYLVNERREWRLGRVEPGAKAELVVPVPELVEVPGLVRLAVIADAPPTVDAGRDPRAVTAIPQPAGSLLSQRWTYTGGFVSAPLLLGAPPARRPR